MRTLMRVTAITVLGAILGAACSNQSEGPRSAEPQASSSSDWPGEPAAHPGVAAVRQQFANEHEATVRRLRGLPRVGKGTLVVGASELSVVVTECPLRAQGRVELGYLELGYEAVPVVFDSGQLTTYLPDGRVFSGEGALSGEGKVKATSDGKLFDLYLSAFVIGDAMTAEFGPDYQAGYDRAKATGDQTALNRYDKVTSEAVSRLPRWDWSLTVGCSPSRS